MSCTSRWSHAERRVIGSLMIALALTSGLAQGREAPAYVRNRLESAQVLGQGRLTWLGLTIYDARLYVSGSDFDSSTPISQPFVLELTYARALQGRAIAERSHEEITRLRFGSEERRKRWLEQMAALFPDVRVGQQLAGIHQPGGATHFYLDGRLIGRIDDPEFGRAFFAIWFDTRTREPGLRARLLKLPG
ncbi:MAG: chalcone isomerase family protein [Burkholderiaceae bacterium]